MNGSCRYLSDHRRMFDSTPSAVCFGGWGAGEGGLFPLPLPSNVLDFAFSPQFLIQRRNLPTL